MSLNINLYNNAKVRFSFSHNYIQGHLYNMVYHLISVSRLSYKSEKTT